MMRRAARNASRCAQSDRSPVSRTTMTGTDRSRQNIATSTDTSTTISAGSLQATHAAIWLMRARTGAKSNGA